MPINGLLTYNGLWRFYTDPSNSHVVLTVTNFQALAILAILSAFFAFTQTRWWILTKVILIRKLYPLRLENEEDAILWDLSQPAAISRLLRKKPRLGLNPRSGMVTISPWFGVCCIVNIILFIIAGASAPYCLTGFGEVAVVQTTMPKLFPKLESMAADTHQSKITTPRSQVCWLIGPDCEPTSRMLSFRPSVSIIRDMDCPFQEQACLPDVASVLIQHSRLSPYDFGINSNLNLSINHKLTCSPLNTSMFIHPLRNQHTEETTARGSIIWFGQNLSADEIVTKDHGQYGRRLDTMNELNQYYGGGFDAPLYLNLNDKTFNNYTIDIFPPDYINLGDNYNWHPSLYRPDGASFVVMFRARLDTYFSRIAELFHAVTWWQNGEKRTARLYFEDGHKYMELNISESGWMPAREAIALGCVEQFQICIGKDDNTDLCRKWSSVKQTDFLQLEHRVLEQYPPHSIRGAGFISYWLERGLYEKLSVLENFKRVTDGLSGLPPLLELSHQFNWETMHTQEQWVREVSVWFEISFLRTRAWHLMNWIFPLISKSEKEYLLAHPQKSFLFKKADQLMVQKKYINVHCLEPICKGKLFLDTDHTNISFTGLMATSTLLLLICGLSYGKIIMASRWWRRTVSRMSGYWPWHLSCPLLSFLRESLDFGIIKGLKSKHINSWPRTPGLDLPRGVTRQFSHDISPTATHVGPEPILVMDREDRRQF